MVFHHCNENVPDIHFRNLVTLALVDPVDGKFCFKKQMDGMVCSLVVGFAGAPCIEASVLAAVGPDSNPASDFYCVSFPLSLLSVSFICPVH